MGTERSANERRWEWEWPVFQWEKISRICQPPDRYLFTVALFRHNWYNILKDDCRNIFVWFSKYYECFQNFYFSTIDVQFSVEPFLCWSTVECLYIHFIVLLCVLGNGMGTGIPWELERMEIDCMRLGGSGSVKLRCVKFYFRSSLFRTTIAADRPIRRRNISHPTLGGTDRAWMFLKPSEWSG